MSIIRATIVFDSDQLSQLYYISIPAYDIPPISTNSDGYSTYNIDGLTLFGINTVAPPFILITWIYNLIGFWACLFCAIPLVYLVSCLISQWE